LDGEEVTRMKESEKFIESVHRINNTKNDGQRFSSDELHRIGETMLEGIQEAEAGGVNLGRTTVEEYRQIMEGLYAGFVFAK
jgi:hypothetical protein